MHADLRYLPGRTKPEVNQFVGGTLSIPLVLFPIGTFQRGHLLASQIPPSNKLTSSFAFASSDAGTALALLGVLTSHMSGHLSMLNCQGAAGLGMVLVIISFILLSLPRLLFQPTQQTDPFTSSNSFERTDLEIRQALNPPSGGLGTCLWLGLTGALTATLSVLASILASADETRKNGSLIKKETYKVREPLSSAASDGLGS